MGKKDKQRQFKENKSHGEHRNGRLAQFKNRSVEFGQEPDEYLNSRNPQKQ